MTQTNEFPILIIGAGFSGIGMAIRLQQAGIHSFTIVERAAEIGGTWRDNTYPGAACDVPSHLYSLSFEPNPNWSRMFAESDEIQNYLLHCVDKYQLRSKIKFDTEIVEARFHAAQGEWRVKTATDETLTARVVISAVGGLVDPATPEIPGLEDFQGKTFHTARWDHEYDLAGKKVAVIGTGASAVQVVPSIAEKVDRLNVFQRTPAWVVPKQDFAFTSGMKQRFRRSPLAMKWLRARIFAFSELIAPLLLLNSPRLSRIGERMSERHLAASVSDPELREKLTPRFQFGCKRMLISDDYWSTFERDNVSLNTEAIQRIHADRIECADGTSYPADAIVFATGFKVGFSAAPFAIFGLGGQPLSNAWKSGASAYKGVSVSGFPNFFILMGPNTGPGHTSVLVYTERQMGYTLQAIERMLKEPIRYMNVREDIQTRYNARLQARMKYMVWGSGCQSWYLSEDGTNRALYPGLASEYCWRLRKFRPSEYEIVRGSTS